MILRLRFVAILVLCLSVLPVQAIAAPVRVAVLPLDLVNVGASQRETLTALLLQRLATIGRFTLIHPTRVAQELQQGQSCGRRAGCLQRVGQKLGHPRLLQLAVAALGDTYIVRLTLFDPRSGARTGSWQEVLGTLDRSRLAPALDRMIAGFAPRPLTEGKSWYARWWVWTAAASVVAAGAAITAVVLTSGNGASPVDVVITPPRP